MKVYIKGQGEVSLGQGDFVASGGEGDVYALGSTAYKIYKDPRKMVPSGKIQELAVLKDPCFLKPEQVLTNKAGAPIGYSMRFLPSGFALCQLFPRAFRDRNHVTTDHICRLVQKLRDGVEYAHRAQILIVDLNEMNFLVDTGFKDLSFIDVDSYQTPHYPATALMDSVRDRHMQSNQFSTVTDWFSFGIVAFQLLVGIHPYKGKHPTYKGLDERMQANVSVLQPDVHVPATVYPFSVIPEAYKQWFSAVFDRGERVAPPSDLTGAVVIIPQVRMVNGTLNLDFGDLDSFPENVSYIWESFGSLVVSTQDGLYLNGRRVHSSCQNVAVAFTARLNKPVLFEGGDSVKLTSLNDKTQIPFGLHVDQMMSTGGRVYVKTGDKVLEVVLTEAGDKIIASTKLAASVLPKATKLFEGGAVQDLLGAVYISLFPRTGMTFQVRVPELDTYKILEARFIPGFTNPADGMGGVLMVLASRKGQYDRLIFRFDAASGYDVRVVEDVTPSGINFTVLDTGVCVSLTENDKLELFSIRKGETKTKVVDDQMLGGDMLLFRRGGQVIVSRGSKTYTMKLR